MPSTLTDVTAFGTMRNGRLFIANRRSFNDDLRRFPEGSNVEIEVHRLRATRSTQFNRWYWLMLGLIAEYTGYTPVELHEAFKAQLIPKDIVLADAHGEVKAHTYIPGSTRKMTTQEFSEYTERVRSIAADLGCVIPDPPSFQHVPDEAYDGTL